MKVAQFTNTIDDGGAETLMLSLTQQLLERGIDAEIHAFAGSWIIQRCIDLKIPHVRLDCSFERVHSIKKLPLWGVKHGLLLNSRGIDVLHSHVYGATLRGAAASFFARKRHVATQHDNHTITEKTKSRVRWLNLAGLLGTDFAMISKQMMDFYIEHGVNKNYCCFIYNGVDGKRFWFNLKHHDKIRQSLNISDDTTVFVAPARLQPIKGFDILIRACSIIKNYNFKLLILGDGPERSNLESLVQQHGLIDKVLFLGAVNNIPEYLSAADVFTLGSRNEGLPCSIIEAMFASLPIVTTNVGGNKELVTNGVNGYLVPSEDSDQLAYRLEDMLDGDKNKQRAMGAESFRHAQNFTIEEMADRYVSLYNGVCLNN